MLQLCDHRNVGIYANVKIKQKCRTLHSQMYVEPAARAEVELTEPFSKTWKILVYDQLVCRTSLKSNCKRL